jgi:hypothetical protein
MLAIFLAILLELRYVTSSEEEQEAEVNSLLSALKRQKVIH